MNAKFARYEQLELLPRGSLSSAPPSPRVKGWQRLGALLLRLLAPSENQPRIRIRYALNGDRVFNVYDPVTQRHLPMTSEEELRLWLEQRYDD